jgi:uncharacterized membrane protein
MNNTYQEDKINIDVLLEIYRQACINSREYMNLRYKRFAIFIAITAIVGAAAFEITELHPYHSIVSAFGIIMTILFWLLDHRTETFYQVKRERLKACEKHLGVVEYFIPSTDELPGIPISILMHLIFATIFLGWKAIEVLIFTTYEFVF